MRRLDLNERPAIGLAVIVMIFFALALVYNWASPLYENSDEFFHFPLIVHLSENGLSLPAQERGTRPDWAQQGNQPPAYHLISALMIVPFDTSDYAAVRRVNPHEQWGIVAGSNINTVLHPLDRSREWLPGTALALRFVRLFSTVLAVGVVISAYFLTVYAFPTLPRIVGLVAAALVAFNPMHLFVASSVNNDNLSNLMISLVLMLLVWLYRRPERPPTRILLLIGVLLGISLLSKLSTGPFMLLVGLTWLALTIKHNAWRYMIVRGFMTLGVALLISGWWYLRNWQLYEDPTGLSRFLHFAGERLNPVTTELLLGELSGFVQSFWGLFGSFTVPLPLWAYTLFNLLAAVSVVGVLLHWVGRWQLNETLDDTSFAVRWLRRLDFAQILLLLWLLISAVGVLRWTSMTMASQGRLWFIALTTLAALSAVGFYSLGRWLKLPILPLLPVGFALTIAAAAPFAAIVPAYAAPERLPRDDFGPALATFSDPAAPAQQMSLVAASFPQTVSAGEDPQVALTLCAEASLDRDWSVFVHLVDSQGLIVAQADFLPGQGAIPTSEVAAGQCWHSTHRLRLDIGVVSSDTQVDVLMGLYDLIGDQARMVRVDAENETVYRLQQSELLAGDVLSRFALGDVVVLDAYTVSQTALAPGELLEVDLTWRAVGAMQRDYTVFVQVLDPETLFRAGASDKGPEPPTSTWAWDVQTVDQHTLVIDEAAPPGIYTLIVGLYFQPQPGQFERLRVSFDGVDTERDALVLTRIRIE